MGKRKTDRRVYCAREVKFLSNKFRRNFIMKFSLIVMIGAVISGAIVYAMSRATVTTSFEGARLKIKSTADFILPAVLLSSAVVVVFISLSTVAIVFFAYRRLKFYLSQIEGEIERVDAGDLKAQLNFRRKDDEFKVLAVSLDKMIRDFRKIVVAIKEDVSKFETDLDEFDVSKDERITRKMRNELKDLKSELEKFNT